MFACSFDENGLLLVYPCEEAEEVLADLIQQEITLSGRIWGCISPERTACEERLFSDSQRSGAQLSAEGSDAERGRGGIPGCEAARPGNAEAGTHRNAESSRLLPRESGTLQALSASDILSEAPALLRERECLKGFRIASNRAGCRGAEI